MTRLVRTETRVDELTGEITAQLSNVISLERMPPEPAYIKLYVDDIGKLHGLKPMTREVLLYVAASMGFDGVATLTARRRAQIALTVGTSLQVVKNCLGECVKAGLLRHVGRGEYEPDPRLFARGTWADIRKRQAKFVATFAYGPAGRQIIDSRPISDDELDRAELEARGQQRLAVDES